MIFTIILTLPLNFSRTIKTMEQTITITQPPITERERLDKTLERTRRTLLAIKTVFPFDLFPDIIRVDENKVEIIEKKFFVEEHIFPILIKNITGVVVTTNPFFATLKVEITGFDTNPDPITFLKKSDAIRAKRIIMGLITVQKDGKDGIDLSNIPLEEVRHKIEEIGKAQEHKNI
jgi:hypothetical protein